MAISSTYSFYLNCSCFPIKGQCGPLIYLEKLRTPQINYLKAFSETVPQSLILCLNNTLAQVFSCEFFEIFKNIVFHGTLLVAVSVFWATYCDWKTSGDTENPSSLKAFLNTYSNLRTKTIPTQTSDLFTN